MKLPTSKSSTATKLAFCKTQGVRVVAARHGGFKYIDDAEGINSRPTATHEAAVNLAFRHVMRGIDEARAMGARL